MIKKTQIDWKEYWDKSLEGSKWLAEWLGLFWTNLVVQKRNAVEFLRVANRYYFNSTFLKIDQALLLSYFFQSPFRISKQYLLRKGEVDPYLYGETPLTSLDHIANTCGINKNDVVYELGCGRGRTCFWLRTFLGCRVVGIDYVPDFMQKAEAVKVRCGVKDVEFRCQDILDTNLADATVIYLYGTAYEPRFIKKLIKKFEELPAGTKIITVSYPLTDYMDKASFTVMKRFPAQFTWGEADVYLQVRN